MTRHPQIPFGTAVRIGDELSRLDYSDLRIKALQRPMHGVRSLGLDVDSTIGRSTAYLARMPDGGCYSDSTAAQLLGVPLPNYAISRELHVTVPAGRRAPEGQGVVGHQRHIDAPAVVLGPLPVLHPAIVWAQLADVLEPHDLVAAGDFLVTGMPFLNVSPWCTIDDLREVTESLSRRRGHLMRVEALSLVRVGPLSRPESLSRLLLTRCGIPEPEVAVPVTDQAGKKVATPDLRWRRFRTSLEYEGDHHREQRQYRYDIGRIERLADTGELIVKAHAGDIFDAPAPFVTRVGARLSSRGWAGAVDLRRVILFRR
jgi:hypothetical protein